MVGNGGGGVSVRYVHPRYSTLGGTEGSATMVVSIILVNNPDTVITPGQQYGIFVAMVLFAPLSNIFISNRCIARSR
jgi:hypothetical protein